MNMNPIHKTNAFEALKMRYEDQVELLRTMTNLDLQIFSGYVTIQLALGAWLAAHGLESSPLKCGMLVLELGLSLIAAYWFWSHYQRRREAIATVENLNEAFGFTKCGTYLDKKAINAAYSGQADRRLGGKPIT